MDDNLNKAASSLSEQTKKLEIAQYYTHGDEDKAKEMISGNYKDLYAIKVKFSSSSIHGAFLMFYNSIYTSLIDSYEIMSHSYAVDDIKSNNEWKIFEKDIEKELSQGTHDPDFCKKLKDELSNCFVTNMGHDQRTHELKKLLDNDDEIILNRFFKKFILDKMGFQNISVSVDYEMVSSLDMEIYSVSSKKVEPKEMARMKGEVAPTEEIKIVPEEDESEAGDAELVLPASLILSPIKGEPVSKLVVGDRIKVALDGANQKAIGVAKAFKAFEDGKILPLASRIVSYRRLSEGGYKIFALVAKGIYVKIEEEEENIKVLMDFSAEGEDKEEDVSKSRMMLIIGIVVGLIVVTSIVIAFAI